MEKLVPIVVKAFSTTGEQKKQTQLRAKETDSVEVASFHHHHHHHNHHHHRHHHHQ